MRCRLDTGSYFFVFKELPYEETRANLEVAGSTLRSKVNKRPYTIGTLETPSLAELRDRAADIVRSLAGDLRVSNVVGDVGGLHRDPANRHALFQVASQFNLLEMTGPDVTPEHGVTRYAFDRTQGPACAIAAGAATIYRNYFAPVDGHTGQTRDRQIDCLRDVGATLRNELHSDVEVTGGIVPGLLVSQVFCSALPVAYTFGWSRGTSWSSTKPIGFATCTSRPTRSRTRSSWPWPPRRTPYSNCMVSSVSSTTTRLAICRPTARGSRVSRTRASSMS